MVLLGKRILEHIGLNPERLRIEFMSSAEGVVFAEVMSDFSRKVRELGPVGYGEAIDETVLKARMDEITKLVPYIKVMKNEKLGTRLLNPEEYDKFFTRDEVDKLINEAPAYYIDPEKCQACMICARRCPAEAIISAKGEVHIINQEECIKCGTCFDVCPPKFKAVTKIVGAPVPLPLPEEKRAIVRKGKQEVV
jgi:NAD-dependent dihydropyrimidine dehydrogenase PreA subunit